MLKKIFRLTLLSMTLMSFFLEASAGPLYTKALLDPSTVNELEAKLSAAVTSVPDILAGKTIHLSDYWHITLQPTNSPYDKTDFINPAKNKLARYGINFDERQGKFIVTKKISGAEKAPKKRSQDQFLDDLNAAYEFKETILPLKAQETLSKLQNVSFDINGISVFQKDSSHHVVLLLMPDLSMIADDATKTEIESSILESYPHISVAKYVMKNPMTDDLLKQDMSNLLKALQAQRFDDITIKVDGISIGDDANQLMRLKAGSSTQALIANSSPVGIVVY